MPCSFDEWVCVGLGSAAKTIAAGGSQRLLDGYGAGMRAAVHTRYGPPDVVRVMEVTTPAVRGGTPRFTRVLTGLPRARVTILGNEFAGQVEEVGPAVTRFAVGDRFSD